MGKKVKIIILSASILGIALFGIVLAMITKKDDLDDAKENTEVVESIPTEKLVIPQNDYNITQSNMGIAFEFFENYEMVYAKTTRGKLGVGTMGKDGFYNDFREGEYCVMRKQEGVTEYLYLRPKTFWDEPGGNEGDRLDYVSFIFLEEGHVVAQSFVVIREDMEGMMEDPIYGIATMNSYATPIKEVQYEKIDGEYQNVTKEYADAWFEESMEEFEIKKAVETVPEKSRFKIIEDYSTDYKKPGNNEKVYELQGIGVEYELENSRQYVRAKTDNGEVVWKKDDSDVTSTICWYDSENFIKDKYDDRVAYVRLSYMENLKVFNLALLKIEYKDDTKTSYTTKIKEVSYKPIDGKSQYISDATAEAWFERAISDFEKEETP